LGVFNRHDAFGYDHGAAYLQEGLTMGPLEIAGAARLALGLLTGILFGFILQKAQVTNYQKIVSFFRWNDLTVQKVMFAGILSGMVGVYVLHDLGFVNLHIKPTLLGANILGGLIFERCSSRFRSAVDPSGLIVQRFLVVRTARKE
jgi:hypothetical protein